MPQRAQCPPGAFPHVVSPGETLNALARRYNTPLQAIIAANPAVRPDILRVGQVICIPGRRPAPACPGGRYYRLRPGDTPWRIAQFFGIPLSDLLAANPGINPNALRVGQAICLPQPMGPDMRCPEASDVYVVRPGDTFWRIAQRRNISLESLRRANPGVNPKALRVGQRICVPVGD